MMNRTGSISTLVPKTAHRQFFQWAVKWFYANITENTSTKPDIPTMICLLQAAGFKLREFEKSDDRKLPLNDPLKPDNVRITMECGTSKMVAVLETDEVSCECPNNEEKDGSFWSITGTGPVSSSTNSVNKIVEAGSNLLPIMTKETTTVVHDVIYKLFNMINNKATDNDEYADSDMNISGANSPRTQSNEFKEGLTRRYSDFYDKNYKPLTSSKIAKNLINAKFGSSRNPIKGTKAEASADALKKPPLNIRQDTFDVEENESIDGRRLSSPSAFASSLAAHQLCTSLGQLSVQSDEELVGLADYVVKAHQILDKAVNFILKKLPSPDSSESSISDDKDLIRPASHQPPIANNNFCLNSSRLSSGSSGFINRSISSSGSSRPGSTSSMPRKTNPPTAVSSIPTISNNTLTRRASSLSGTQRPSLKPPLSNKAQGSLNRPVNRRSTISGASGIAQRRTPTNQGIPVNKPIVTKGTHTSLSTALDAKSNSSGTTPRTHLPFLKGPSTMSRLSNGTPNSGNASVPKFGYSAARK